MSNSPTLASRVTTFCKRDYQLDTPLLAAGRFIRKVISTKLITLNTEALTFFNNEHIINGKKFKHNLQVVGQIDAELESKDITHLSGGLYGIKENKYYFALIDFVN